MPSFAYVSRNQQGAIVAGIVDADDERAARTRLQSQGLFITSLRPGEANKRIFRGSAAEISLLTTHLAMLVSAGMPIYQALETLIEQTDDKKLQEVIQTVAQDIQEGRALSSALGRRPDLFPPLYIGMVRRGEMSGRLDQALEELAAYLERDLEFRRKVREAFIYPAIVLSLAFIVLAVFLTYIIPAFERVYRTTNTALPVLTQLMLLLSRLFRQYLPLAVLGIAALIVPYTRRMVWSLVARRVQRLVLRIPRVGAFWRVALLARFAQTLGTMLKSGVPVIAALDVGAEAVAVAEFTPAVETIKENVNQGRRLSDAMRQTGWFPPMFVRMVALGEESGKLDTTLERAGRLLDREFELRMRRMLTMLEPAITLGLGGFIGLILMSLYLPIFGLSKAVVR